MLSCIDIHIKYAYGLGTKVPFLIHSTKKSILRLCNGQNLIKEDRHTPQIALF